MSVIRIGTRGSPLALAQAHMVAGLLKSAHGLTDDRVEITIFKTSGDRIQDRPLSEAGGKGLFTKELEDALIENKIDIAVHSMKDMATLLPDGLAVAAVLERADPRDAFISRAYQRFADLPAGATVGTSSLRRQAQVLAARPDLNVVGFRGNVETRLKKLAEGVADATFLAKAGLDRLGLVAHATEVRSTADMLPAVAQGVIAIEQRKGDRRHAALLDALDHAPTRIAVAAERAFLARLDGSCRTPIAGHATITSGRLVFHGEILTPDGRERHAASREGPPGDAARLGDDAARELLARAGPAFLARSG